MNIKEMQMIDELIANPQRIEVCMEQNEVMYLCLDCSIKDPKIYVYICQDCLESQTHKNHKIIQTDNGDLSERCSCGDSDMLGVVIECANHNKNVFSQAQKSDKALSPSTITAFEQYAFTNFTRLFKNLESTNSNDSLVDQFYEQFMELSARQPQLCSNIMMKQLQNFYTRHSCQSPSIDIDPTRFQKLCTCTIIENLFRQSEKTSLSLKKILLNCVRYRPFVFQLTKIYSKMLLPLFETENNQLLDLMKEFNPPQVFQVFISQVALVKNIMNLLEKILLNLETANYESFLKKFETLNNLMKFIFKREMQVDENIMKQFCNIISKVCVQRKEIQDYFHEEILIVMEEMNFDFLRLLLNSLHRQPDWKTISSNLIYQFIVKCECEIDYEYSEERKKNPWFQGSVGILGIFLSCTFVEIYEEIVGEEIGQKNLQNAYKNNIGAFLQQNKNGRIIGDIEKVKEAMRQQTLKISKRTQNGFDKLFKSICREIIRDLFHVFSQQRILRNNSRAQNNEDSNEYQMNTVLECYKNRLYYRELSNLQIFALLIPPEMFMQAIFEAMKWKSNRFDKTFYKYQKQYYPQSFEQSPIHSSTSHKAPPSASTAANSQQSSIQKSASSNTNGINSTHKRAVSFQQPKHFSSFQNSPQSNINTEKDASFQRSNRRATHCTETGQFKYLQKDCEDIQDDIFDDADADDDDEDLFDLDEKNGSFYESVQLKYEFVTEILMLCNNDIINLTNNVQPCFKDDKILINEMRRNICVNTFNFQNQISMVNLTNKLDAMKLFDASTLKKIIFNFAELGSNKLLKLKSPFQNKYEPTMWRPYSSIDSEFIEKLKERKFEYVLGNLIPVLEKHSFLSDLPSSPTFLKFIRNSFHFLFKNNQILSNLLKITYELLLLTQMSQSNQRSNESLSKPIDKKKKIKIEEGIQHDVEDLPSVPSNKEDILLSQVRFSLLKLDQSKIQIIQQHYQQSQSGNQSQSPSVSPARIAGMTDNEGFLQSFDIFSDLISKLDFFYVSPKNSLCNIDQGQIEKKVGDNSVNSNGTSQMNIGGSSNAAGNSKEAANNDQQRKQMVMAKQKQIMEQFQNKQKKFQDQNEQNLDKSFNTILSTNNNNNSGNKSHGISQYHHQHSQFQTSPYQESLLEQQECVICKTDLGITVIHSYVLVDNLSSHFQITEKQCQTAQMSSKYAITGCQHITHQKCHEMGMENIQISKRALSKEDQEAQLETFCTICKSLSNISVVVVDCYFQKNSFQKTYLNLFTNTSNLSHQRYLPNIYNSSCNNNSPPQNSSHSFQHPRTPSFTNSISSYPSPSSSTSQSSSSSSYSYIPAVSGPQKGSQRYKTDFKDNTKRILDGLVYKDIIYQDKTIVNQIYSGLEEFLSLLAIISNNEDNIQEQYIYNVGDSLLQSLLEKVLLTQNMENFFEKDFKLLDNLYLNLKVIFKGYDSEQQRLKYEYLNLSIQKILETDFFEYAQAQFFINLNYPTYQVSFCMMYTSIIFRIAIVYGEEQAVSFSRDFLQHIFLIFSIKELKSSQKCSCDCKQNENEFYNSQQVNTLISDIKELWLNNDNLENRENIQIQCIPYLRMISIFLQLVSSLDNHNDRKSSFAYPKNNLDPVTEIENYEKTFGKYFINLDLEFAEHTLKENSKFSSLKFLKTLHEYQENCSQSLNNFLEFDKKIFSLTPINSNFEVFYKQQFWKKCQIDFNFPQIEKSPLIMCLICGLQMADNCQRGLKIVQNDINHAHTVHKGYCVYIQLQDGLLTYVEKDSVQSSQSLYFDKLGRRANCLNHPEWNEFILDKAKYQEVEELIINRKLANHVRYILMQADDDYTYFDDEYLL